MTYPSHGVMGQVLHARQRWLCLGGPQASPVGSMPPALHCMPCPRRGYLGSGSVDCEGLFRGLAEIGYQGPVTFESFSSAVVSPGRRWGRARLRLQLLVGFGLVWGGCACRPSVKCCLIQPTKCKPAASLPQTCPTTCACGATCGATPLTLLPMPAATSITSGGRRALQQRRVQGGSPAVGIGRLRSLDPSRFHDGGRI